MLGHLDLGANRNPSLPLGPPTNSTGPGREDHSGRWAVRLVGPIRRWGELMVTGVGVLPNSPRHERKQPKKLEKSWGEYPLAALHGDDVCLGSQKIQEFRTWITC